MANATTALPDITIYPEQLGDQHLKAVRAAYRRRLGDLGYIRRAGRLDRAAIAALCEALNLDRSDIEYLTPVSRSASTVAYVNTGDTYSRTIIVYLGWNRVSFKIGTWGDLVESGRYK